MWLKGIQYFCRDGLHYYIKLGELLLILFCFRKTFITYKNILKIYFDYSNGANATTQKGCKYPFIVYSYTVLTRN